MISSSQRELRVPAAVNRGSRDVTFDHSGRRVIFGACFLISFCWFGRGWMDLDTQLFRSCFVVCASGGAGGLKRRGKLTRFGWTIVGGQLVTWSSGTL